MVKLKPSKILLTMTRVGFKPCFRKVRSSGYMRKIAQTCLSRVHDEYMGRKTSEKNRALEEALTPNFPCPGFLVERHVRRIRGSEVSPEPGLNLDPNFNGLPSPELPLEIEHNYSFGLLSRRLVAPVFLRRDMSIHDLLFGWERLAKAFRLHLEKGFDVPGEWTSNLYSEIYILEGSIAGMRREEAEMLISIFKRRPSPSMILSKSFKDPMVVSKDGFLIQLRRSGRAYRDVRRKMRRVLRLAVDIVLGQKVFYSSPTLWRIDEGSWGAMVGLIYLNPKLWGSKATYPSTRMYSAYKRVLAPVREEVEEGYKSYSSTFGAVYFGMKVAHLPSITLNMAKLRLDPIPPTTPLLDKLEYLVLVMLCVKDSLDGERSSRLERYSRMVSKILCSEFNPNDECVKQLPKKIGSRLDRRGLSAEEIEVLLGGVYSSPRGILKKKNVMASLMDKGMVRKEVSERKGSGRPKVDIYLPEVDQRLVSWLKSVYSVMKTPHSFQR